jgi:hypothetical protein
MNVTTAAKFSEMLEDGHLTNAKERKCTAWRYFNYKCLLNYKLDYVAI